ncbi:MAG: hypothetical protein J7604_23925 [Sporocytophaga sp.]|uniref:hypothetical protein n=1 Tax=Sporocytophaga sp. TaxID=2231183 RepID=UPI001B027BF1|nr:hypothetical protein [Sporocytophaga sp.]MBO9703284.1 hypothetical protein [Sporocytophaga sp.]
MKPFNNEINFEIKEELPSIIKTIQNTDKTLLVEIHNNSFEAVEKSGYFKISQIKDYKFIGNLSTVSSTSTALRMNIKLSKIGKINLFIVGFFILYALFVSFFFIIHRRFESLSDYVSFIICRWMVFVLSNKQRGNKCFNLTFAKTEFVN